jgi:hypothetical protein
MLAPVASTYLSAALDYAAMGLAVFPVGPDCKPGSLRKLHAVADGEAKMLACYDATMDPEAIRAYWGRYPEANVSIATGPVSGLFVLDVDAKDGFDGHADINRLEAMHGTLPLSWRSATPSGGEHRWYRMPERALRNRVHFPYSDVIGQTIKSGLDVRAYGAAAAAPPSRKPTGVYAWIEDPWTFPLADAPAWLLDIIDPPPPPRAPPKPVRVSDLDRTSRYVAAAVDSECNTLAGMSRASGRNLRLFMAAANLGEFVGAGLLPQSVAEDALEGAAAECGLTHEDGPHAIRATIASGMRKGMANPREVRP